MGTLILKNRILFVRSFICTAFLFLNNLYAQVESPYDKGWEVGFVQGYCYNRNTVDCRAPLTPLPPLPRVDETSQNYTQGYNRGFQTGLDLKRVQSGSGSVNGIPFNNIPSYKFNDYVPQIPVDAYVDVGMYKQRLYNLRVQWIQDRINSVHDFNKNLLGHLDPVGYERIRSSIIRWLVENLEGKRLDFSDNRVFNQIYNAFNVFERNIVSQYQIIVNDLAVKHTNDSNTDTLKNSTPVIVTSKSSAQEYSGDIHVYTNAPILDKPNSINSRKIGTAQNNLVTIIERANELFYHVKSGELDGFLWLGWIKEK